MPTYGTTDNLYHCFLYYCKYSITTSNEKGEGTKCIYNFVEQKKKREKARRLIRNDKEGLVYCIGKTSQH